MEEHSQTAGDVLLEQPWLPVCIGDCQLLAKAWFGDTSYYILLTDMHCVWEERMDSSAIQNRAQELNSRLRAPVKAFFAHLREVALPCLSGGLEMEGEPQVSFTRRGDGSINVRLKSELVGLPFYWEFHCTPPPVEMVCSQLVRPLLMMSQLLQAQVDQLGVLLSRKDTEIQDYKENGATLSRARLQTEVFDEQAYKDNFLAQTLPQVSSGQPGGLGFDADLRELYTAVAAHGNAGKRKRPEGDASEEAGGQEAERTPSPATTPGDGVGRDEATQAEEKRQSNRRDDAARIKTDDKPMDQQPPAVMAQTADRPASRPKKKKKGVGLFR